MVNSQWQWPWYSNDCGDLAAFLIKNEPTPETHKIKKVSFGDLYIFFNELILRHHRISINVNLIQNN
ncbi:MAG: hypothetical protein V3V00_07335, partial [Saprospiraceae bacterium]